MPETKTTLLQVWQQLRKDEHLIIFTINAILVVFGYYIGNVLPGLFPIVKLGKMAFLVYAVVTQVAFHYNNQLGSKGLNMGWIYLYLAIIFLTIPFSFDATESFSRYITYLGGIVYLALFSKYVMARYQVRHAVLLFSLICVLSYFLPVLVAIVRLPFLASVQFHIYGDKAIAKSLGFMSNNFGWAGTITFTGLFMLISNTQVIGKMRWFFVSIMIFCVFLILVSESRSSLLIMALSLVLIISGPRVSVGYKVLTLFAIILVVLINLQFELLDLGTSRFNDKLLGDKTNLGKEFRVVVFENTKQFFYFHQEYYFHGFGWGVFVPAYQKFIDSTNDMDMHNTYLQLLYETGVFSFIVFLFAFFLPAAFKFFVYFKQYLIFLPFLILPYFENNLNSGQFVFFPFMFTLFYLGSYRTDS
jgi:O-antigen ligase